MLQEQDRDVRVSAERDQCRDCAAVSVTIRDLGNEDVVIFK